MRHVKAESLLELLASRPATINEVVEQLSAIIKWAQVSGSRLGYFPALYRKVTLSVKDGIAQGIFDDGPRMERFDVIFANRYLDAFAVYCNGGVPSQSWRFAFECCEQYWPIVLQHLLLGMNAHINLDLGIAAAETMRGRNMEDLRNDFNTINRVLGSLVDDVQNELAEVWKMLGLMNRYLGSIDDAVVNFSMERARDESWRSAQNLWSSPDTGWPEVIAGQDRKTLAIATLVRHPGAFLGTVTRIVRIGERGSIPQIIEILS